jgi:hypothetical protein
MARGGMDKKAKRVVAGLAASGLLGLGAAVVRAAVNSVDDDRPLKGRNYDRASSAALEHVGGGTVTYAETGDNGEAYEVDVRRDDGRQVEAELDSNFNVTGPKPTTPMREQTLRRMGTMTRADDDSVVARGSPAAAVTPSTPRLRPLHSAARLSMSVWTVAQIALCPLGRDLMSRLLRCRGRQLGSLGLTKTFKAMN